MERAEESQPQEQKQPVEGLHQTASGSVTVTSHDRELMSHPVLEPELDIIRNSSIAGGLFAGLMFFCAGAYVSYSTTLASSGVSLDMVTRGRFEAFVVASKSLTLLFGIFAVFLQLRVAWKVRKIKRTDFQQLPNGTWVRINLRGPSFWRKLWTGWARRAHALADRWASKPLSLL